MNKAVRKLKNIEMEKELAEGLFVKQKLSESNLNPDPTGAGEVGGKIWIMSPMRL